MKSAIPFTICILALFFVLFENNISLGFILLSVALIENCLTLIGINYPNQKKSIKDFRFKYAAYASRIYYPIALIITYFFYIYFRQIYSNSDILFTTLVLLLFSIFRLASLEILEYLNKKILVKTRSIDNIKTSQNELSKQKISLLEILNECKYSIDKHEEKKLIHNIINTIEFSSVNIDPALIGLCKQLQSDLKNETVSPSRLKDSLANIADRL